MTSDEGRPIVATTEMKLREIADRTFAIAKKLAKDSRVAAGIKRDADALAVDTNALAQEPEKLTAARLDPILKRLESLDGRLKGVLGKGLGAV